VKNNPEYKKEARTDVKLLKSQEFTNDESKIEKTKRAFLAILKDIEKDIEADKSIENPTTVQF